MRIGSLVFLLAVPMLAQSTPPATLEIDGAFLAQVKSHPNPAILDAVHAEADEAMAVGPYSVMDEDETPPSGDKHDYMSLAPYWWPDPAKPNGLPYIRRRWRDRSRTLQDSRQHRIQ